MDAIDIDFGLAIDLVDVFLVDIQPASITAGGAMTSPQSYQGRFGVASIQLSFQLACQSGFFGEECVNTTLICDTVPCDNGGLCESNEVTGFTCTCVGDFTGDTCDTRINNCLNVDCNNGTCVDGIQSFSCECVADYTGQFCDQTITDITKPSSTDAGLTNPTDASIDAGVVAGAVIGGVVGTLILVTIILVLVLGILKVNSKTHHQFIMHVSADRKPMPCNKLTTKNLVYDITGKHIF